MAKTSSNSSLNQSRQSLSSQLPSEESAKSSSEKTVTLIVPRWIYCYMPIVLVIVSAIVAAVLTNHKRYILESTLLEKTDTLGWDAVDMFSSFDKDGDFYLSIEEAAPLLLQFVGKSKGENTTINADVLPGEEVVMIEARFTPLNISTMTKDWEHDFNNNASFHGLFTWLSPHIPAKEFGVSKFRDLLPDDLETIPVPGTVYTIVGPPTGMFGYSSLPSTRFYPPRVFGQGNSVYRLLSMFHSQPFVVMRFPPQGIIGCVRAVSKNYVEVVFRMHAEFQLNEPPNFPFWFTPAQFTGSLLMSRDGSSVKHFHLYVPNDRPLNVDMEWLNEKDNPDSMEVDIGYMPQMELVSTGQSSPQDNKTEDLQAAEIHSVVETPPTDIIWDQEISYEEARHALELKLFPFKQIKYYNFSEAFDQAKAENKLVHSILLWGALDDQSC